MPGTHLHANENSTTTNNMLDLSFNDLYDLTEEKYKIALMKNSAQGGGMIAPCSMEDLYQSAISS